MAIDKRVSVSHIGCSFRIQENAATAVRRSFIGIMKIIGIICMVVGLTFGILHTINGNVFGVMTSVMAFICGLLTVLTN